MTFRGVSVAQDARDLDVHATVLRRWIREFGLSGREVAKLKAERNILKKPWPTSSRNSCDVWVRGETTSDLAGRLDV